MCIRDSCYAYERGRYRFQNVKDAQYKRFAALKHPLWAPAMALQINSKKVKYFRWHDSGDVQNLDHLQKIYEVCRLSPDVKHWMPTREAWVKDHLDSCPDNLIIRLSAPMVDQAAPSSWPHTSTVVTSGRTCRPLTRATNVRTVELAGTRTSRTLHTANIRTILNYVSF